MSLFHLLGEIFGFYKECPIVVNDCCPICLNTITEGGRIDCCKHTFCLDCIKQWSKSSNHCPECRKAFHYITPCKVFKNEEELQSNYSMHSDNFDSSNGERIDITDLQCNIRGSGLLIAKKSENASYQSASGLVRRYSSR